MMRCTFAQHSLSNDYATGDEGLETIVALIGVIFGGMIFGGIHMAGAYSSRLSFYFVLTICI